MQKAYVIEEKRVLSIGYLNQFHRELQRRMKEKEEAEQVSRLSSKFSDGFQETLLSDFGNTKVQAETVYMQYMLKKGSVHIFKTKWKTLEDFVKYQGRLAAFRVEYDNKVWYIQSSTPTKEKSVEKPLTSTENISTKPTSDVLQRAVTKMSQGANSLPDETKGVQLSKAESDETCHQEDSSPEKAKPWTCKRSRIQFKMSDRSKPYSKDSRVLKNHKPTSVKAKLSNRKSSLQALMEEAERSRETQNRRDNWLQAGIIVQIVTDKYGKKNNRKRCRIVGMTSPYSGVGYVMSTDVVLQVDQQYLRTCLPEPGSLVRIVNGAYRDEIGVLEKIWKCETGDIKCCVRLVGSPLSGRLLKSLSSDDVCEIYQSLKG